MMHILRNTIIIFTMLISAGCIAPKLKETPKNNILIDNMSTLPLINIRDCGAVGNGTTDDYAAIMSAYNTATALNGCVYVPAGTFRFNSPINFSGLNHSVTTKGDGPMASVLLYGGAGDAITLGFAQLGNQQPWGATFMDLSVRPIGHVSGSPIKISYGSPAISNDHYRPSVIIRNVTCQSDDTNTWGNGIDVTSAWNCEFTDVFVSGNPNGGNWNLLAGSGFALHRSCVNSHFVNCKANFWSNGFSYDTGAGATDPNTEGLFFANCSFVAVHKGCQIFGNTNNITAPRVSGFTWTGGLIELRQSGTSGGSAAFHLVGVWDGMITGAMILNDTLTITSYGLFLDRCVGINVGNCDIQAWTYGVITIGACSAVNSNNNVYSNCTVNNIFTGGTTASRSYGHTVAWSTLNDVDASGNTTNRFGFVN
jgi:hypothetical protein